MFKKYGNGFSLVDIIIYIALLSIVGVALFDYSFTMISGEAKTRTIAETQQNLRFAMNKMASEIRSATGVNTGSSTFDTHPGVLSLAAAPPANDPTVFSLSGAKLQVKYGAGNPIDVTTDKVEVTSLIFKDLSEVGRLRNIGITLTIRHKNPQGVTEFSWEETMQMTVSVRRFP